MGAVAGCELPASGGHVHLSTCAGTNILPLRARNIPVTTALAYSIPAPCVTLGFRRLPILPAKSALPPRVSLMKISHLNFHQRVALSLLNTAFTAAFCHLLQAQTACSPSLICNHDIERVTRSRPQSSRRRTTRHSLLSMPSRPLKGDGASLKPRRPLQALISNVSGVPRSQNQATVDSLFVHDDRSKKRALESNTNKTPGASIEHPISIDEFEEDICPNYMKGSLSTRSTSPSDRSRPAVGYETVVNATGPPPAIHVDDRVPINDTFCLVVSKNPADTHGMQPHVAD